MEQMERELEKERRKLVKKTEKYEIFQCKYQGRENIDTCPLSGVYMAVGGNAIKGCTPIGINTSSCLYSQYCGLIAQNLYDWPPLVCDIDPDDVIFGVEDKAIEAIIRVEEVYDCNLIFVASGFASDIIGTDLEGVIKAAKTKLQRAEVIYTESGGFKGNAIDGYDFVLNALVNQLMLEPKEKWKRTVNILGIFPRYDIYWEGNVHEIRRILDNCGIKVHCVLTGDCDVQRIKEAPQASLNVVLSGIMGVKAAQLMREKFGIPYVSASQNVPIGFEGTRNFIAEICEALGVEDYHEVLDAEEEKTKRRMVEYVDVIWDILMHSGYFAVRGNLDLAIGLVNFLGREMGWAPYLIGLTRYNDVGLKTLEVAIDEVLDTFLHPKATILLDPDDLTMKIALLGIKGTVLFICKLALIKAFND